MSIKQLVRDDDAVSPVIGVILMVAITVILAAVIGAFVLNMGDSVEQEAQGAVMWSVDSDSYDVTVTATSMPRADRIEIRGDTPGGAVTLSDVGNAETLDFSSGDSGTLTAVAIYQNSNGETVETTVGTRDYDV